MYEKQYPNNMTGEDINNIASKPKKIYKITEVKTAPIVGIPSLKFGCFKSKLLRCMFAKEIFANLTNDDYTKFMRKHADTKKEFLEFKDKIEFCDHVLDD